VLGSAPAPLRSLRPYTRDKGVHADQPSTFRQGPTTPLVSSGSRCRRRDTASTARPILARSASASSHGSIRLRDVWVRPSHPQRNPSDHCGGQTSGYRSAHLGRRQPQLVDPRGTQGPLPVQGDDHCPTATLTPASHKMFTGEMPLIRLVLPPACEKGAPGPVRLARAGARGNRGRGRPQRPARADNAQPAEQFQRILVRNLAGGNPSRPARSGFGGSQRGSCTPP
jgi:hypothetical protein